jgi:hypothetical protein
MDLRSQTREKLNPIKIKTLKSERKIQMKTLTIFIIALTVLNFGAVAAFADDMWSETPDLENLKAPSFTTEPSRMSNKAPTVDMWAETPTLDNKNEKNGVQNYGSKNRERSWGRATAAY